MLLAIICMSLSCTLTFSSVVSSSATSPSDSSQSSWGKNGTMNTANVLKTISYLPVALYAENFRVRKALITSICSGIAISPALTGCVRDLHELWDLEEWEVFEDIRPTNLYHVASLRHGITFPAANGALLKLLGLAGSRKLRSDGSVTVHTLSNPQRDTSVSVIFVSPTRLMGIDPPVSRPWWLSGFCMAIAGSEMVTMIGLATLMAYFEMLRGSMLMGCMLVNATILLFMQYKCTPMFAKSRDLSADREKTAAAGAALDVHVVTTSWNSSHIDVLCGYSSHLHSITNLPVRITNPWMVPLCCRILAISLLAQAAVLASLFGVSDINALIPLIWLGLYIIMLIPPALISRQYPSMLLDAQPGIVNPAITARFSERRAALCFIAMLPVSPNAGKWDFMEGFIPKNPRREKWQEEIDALIRTRDQEPRPCEIVKQLLLIDSLGSSITFGHMSGLFAREHRIAASLSQPQRTKRNKGTCWIHRQSLISSWRW